MHPPHVKKMTFITPRGLYCYNVMPFGLKNAGVTYQRLVTKIFQPLISKTMEVYINDMLVKSKERPYHLRHLQETFERLRRYDMKLNPLKCVLADAPILTSPETRGTLYFYLAVSEVSVSSTLLKEDEN